MKDAIKKGIWQHQDYPNFQYDQSNERQIKVLNKILDRGSENFEGGLSTKNYISLTKVSKATAIRDISELLERGCIEHIEGTAGRNVRYKVTIPTYFKT